MLEFFGNPAARDIVRLLDDGSEDEHGQPTGIEWIPREQLLLREDAEVWLKRGENLLLLRRARDENEPRYIAATHLARVQLDVAASTVSGENVLQTYAGPAVLDVLQALLQHGPLPKRQLERRIPFPRATLRVALTSLRATGVVEDHGRQIRIAPSELGACLSIGREVSSRGRVWAVVRSIGSIGAPGPPKAAPAEWRFPPAAWAQALWRAVSPPVRCSFQRLWIAHARSHCCAAGSLPRTRSFRPFWTVSICPNTGSTIALRLA